MLDSDGQGDYYTSNGVLQGKDKFQDNKAYLIASATKDKDGNFINPKLLPVTNSVLNQYANTVAQESSGDKLESYALASAISNLAAYKKKSISKTLQTEGIYGYKDGGSSTAYNKNVEYSMEAVINALFGGKDYSNGAIRWDGFDLAARGFGHPKPRMSGVDISEPNFLAFKKAWPNNFISKFSGGKYTSFSSNFSSGRHPADSGANKGYVLYSASAVHGRTMFWKANLNATRTVIRNGQKKVETYKYSF